MENVQKQPDTLKDDNFMDHSTLLKQKSVHFTSQNRTAECSDAHHVVDNGMRKQIFAASIDRFLYELRRSLHLLAKKQKLESLRELSGLNLDRVHGNNNSLRE